MANRFTLRISFIFDRLILILGGFWLVFVVSLPLLYFLYLKFSQDAVRTSYVQSGDNISADYQYTFYIWAAIMSTTWLFGALGATASYVSRSKAQPMDGSLVMSQIFGIIFSSVMALIFFAGLISGSLFPDFSTTSSFIDIKVNIHDWSKLLVWSFIAGFFERFVPDLLRSLVRQADASKDQHQ